MKTTTKTIKVPVTATVETYGRGASASRTVSAAGLRLTTGTEAELLRELTERLQTSLERDAVGTVQRVALVGRDVYALVVRLGEVRAYKFALDADGTATWGERWLDSYPRRECRTSIDEFEAEVGSLRRRRAATASSISAASGDCERLLRVVAEGAEVDPKGDPADVAQRLALRLAELRTSAQSDLPVLPPDTSPQAAAFARLLGLRPGDPRVAEYARGVLLASEGERWALTLRDLCSDPNSLLAEVDEAARALPDLEEARDEIADLRYEAKAEYKYDDWQEVEEAVVDSGWSDGGPLDREIADMIEGDTLEGRSAKALRKRIDEAVDVACQETRDELTVGT